MFIKKYFIFFLLFILSNISLFPQPFDGKGDGTKDDPFQIWTKEHLLELYDSSYSDYLKGPSLYWHRYKHFRLMLDIYDVSDRINYVGFSEARFYGSGKKINAARVSPYFFSVLFSTLSYNSAVDSLILNGYMGNDDDLGLARITNVNEGIPYGAPPNSLPGIISYCINNVAVANIDAVLYTYGVAGIAYSNKGIISHCINNGSVTGVDRVAGIASANTNIITNCINTGKIIATNSGSGPNETEGVGGIVAFNMYNIFNCINLGIIEGVNNVGGILGMSSISNTSPIISNCLNLGYVSGKKYVGGILGIDHGIATISNCLNVGVVEGEEDVGSIVGKEE